LDKRYNTILRGMLESLEYKDDVQTEFWTQVGRISLGVGLGNFDQLSIRLFDTEFVATESQWFLDFRDKDIYGYYVYFVRLSNKQASLSVDNGRWVKTPIFLRANVNSGLYLDVSNVPPGVETSMVISGYEFSYKSINSEQCDNCIHRVDTSMTSKNRVCALLECDYEPLESIVGSHEKSL